MSIDSQRERSLCEALDDEKRRIAKAAATPESSQQYANAANYASRGASNSLTMPSAMPSPSPYGVHQIIMQYIADYQQRIQELEALRRALPVELPPIANNALLQLIQVRY